jgi:hypothetical protein
MPDEIPNERKAPRIAVLGHAVVTGPNLRSNCIIRDLSSTGAKLGISGKVKLPAAFDLWLLKTRSKRRVVLRWRRGDFAGVEFCQRMAGTMTAAASAGEEDSGIA